MADSAGSTAIRDSWGFVAGDIAVPHCRVRAKLGGGHSYETFDTVDDRLFAPVVVKMVRPHLVSSEGVLRDLQREIDLTERLRHPLVVRNFHADGSGPRPYVGLEKLPGRGLDRILTDEGTLSTDRIIAIGMGIATVLHYFRVEDVVHLDVSTNNIILDGSIPRLIDFDIARDTAAARELDFSHGSPRCSAPEQCDPPRAGKAGPASDIWGLGAVLFRCAAGDFPFREGVEDPAAPAADRFPQLTDGLRPMPASVTPGLRDVILACLQRDPGARPLPSEVFFALEALTGRSSAIVPDAKPPRTPAPRPDDRELFRSALEAKNPTHGARKRPPKPSPKSRKSGR